MTVAVGGSKGEAVGKVVPITGPGLTRVGSTVDDVNGDTHPLMKTASRINNFTRFIAISTENKVVGITKQL